MLEDVSWQMFSLVDSLIWITQFTSISKGLIITVYGSTCDYYFAVQNKVTSQLVNSPINPP